MRSSRARFRLGCRNEGEVEPARPVSYPRRSWLQPPRRQEEGWQSRGRAVAGSRVASRAERGKKLEGVVNSGSSLSVGDAVIVHRWDQL